MSLLYKPYVNPTADPLARTIALNVRTVALNIHAVAPNVHARAPPEATFRWVKTGDGAKARQVEVSLVCRQQRGADNVINGAFLFFQEYTAPVDQSRSLNRNIPHSSTNHGPSIGIYRTRRPITIPQ
eukprot:5375958-Pyramimonas_sp.AAC.2